MQEETGIPFMVHSGSDYPVIGFIILNKMESEMKSINYTLDFQRLINAFGIPRTHPQVLEVENTRYVEAFLMAIRSYYIGVGVECTELQYKDLSDWAKLVDMDKMDCTHKQEDD